MPPPAKTSAYGWNAEAVEDGIRNTRFANRIHHHATVTSTSTLALEAAHTGTPEGHVWVADEQTAGRGRGGHTWLSTPTDGLYVSVLVRPGLPPEQALWLSLLTGLAVQSAILEVTGHQPDLRWPNDLLLGEKKVGGILVETSLTAEQTPAMRHAVIGIGLNVAHPTFPPELEPIATSLYRATGVVHPREIVLAAVLRALDRELATTPSESLLPRFTGASTWVEGKPVQVGENPGYTGITAGLDPRGFLLVQTEKEGLRTVLSGGVRPA